MARDAHACMSYSDMSNERELGSAEHTGSVPKLHAGC